MTASAIYEGWIRHRRHWPVPHHFRMPLFMMYLDLGEVPCLLQRCPLWSSRRPAPAWFRRSDYLGDPATSLDQCVRDVVQEQSGEAPRGPIRMLTHVRQWGYCFNPVTFYYCFDPSGTRVESIAAQITNTPWKERHTYVLTRSESTAAPTRQRFQKVFHVSPFLPMDMEYDWTFRDPGEQLFVHMNCREEGRRTFDATLMLRRHAPTGMRLARDLARYPFMTLAVITRIHFEALRLWLKRVPVHPHPKTAGPHQKDSA